VARGARDQVQYVDVFRHLKKDLSDQEQSRPAGAACGQLRQLAELSSEKLLLRGRNVFGDGHRRVPRHAASEQFIPDGCGIRGGHVEHRGIRRAHRIDPAGRRLAFAHARSREDHAARHATARKGNLRFRARRERSRDAGDNFHRDLILDQKANLFMGAAEEHRVAALEPHHHAVVMGSIGEPLVDEALRGRMPPAALADGDLFSLYKRKDSLGNQSIMENNVRLAEQPGRAHGEEVGCTRPGADEIDSSAHCTSPAATV